MVKDHSVWDIGNVLAPHGLLFPIGKRAELFPCPYRTKGSATPTMIPKTGNLV